MSEKVYKIVNTLSERLQQCAQSASEVGFGPSGSLFGFTSVTNNNETYVLGCTSQDGEVPPGTTLLGAFFLNHSLDQSAILDQCANFTKSKKSGKFIVVYCAAQKLTVRLYDIKPKKLGEANYEIVDYQKAYENSVQIALTAVFSLNDYYRSSDVECFKSGFDQIKQALDESKFALRESKFCLSKENESELLAEDLYNQIEEFDELADVQIPANMKKKIIEKNQRKLKSEKQALRFQLANDLAISDIVDQVELVDNASIDFKFKTKIVFNVQLQNNLQYLFRLFITALTRVVNKFEKCIFKSIKASTLKLPKVVNFYEPSIYTHVITEVFCNLEDKEDYKAQRRQVHLNYLIPINTPTFKIVKSCENACTKTDGRLMNVHRGLNCGIQGGQCVTVSGNYLYYHYNQDQTNDSGWGCAYRSLQTIISWFQLQGYIDETEVMPTHTQIQQVLVDVGDKPANFVGSSKWIGSQEVCYVLDQLYGLKSKIIFINSGEELTSKARELIQHFNTNGTPIMIGGGVLAHTIIGVHFDDTTGNIKFLVLDPHFVGADDLSVIHKKGWCGWKPITFWDKHSFYNLCLPQRPIDY